MKLQSRQFKAWRLVVLVILICGMFLPTMVWAQVKQLSIAYQPYPIHLQQIKWAEKWGKEHGIKIIRAPISYEAFVQKVTSSFLTPEAPFDITWHNDDWGEMWQEYLEPIEDIKGFENICPNLYTYVFDYKGHITGMPMVATDAGIHYRKDLIPAPPQDWKEMQTLAIALQYGGKVKWGYVGGVRSPHTWGTLYWSLRANNCGVFWPAYVVNSTEFVASYGFTPMVTDDRFVEAVEFWWDNLNKYHICPPGMVNYSRTDANALYMAGNAAMMWQDSVAYGEFNDPTKSKVAGKTGLMPFPAGPHGKKTSWDVCWGWAIPKNIPEERKKVAKELLSFLISDKVQLDLWKTTGGIPVTVSARKHLLATDPLFREVANATFKTECVYNSGGYFFPEWVEVDTICSDYFVKALLGPREKIREVLEKADEEIRKVVKKARRRYGFK